MAANKVYNISDLRMLAPKYRSVSGTETLGIRVYNGTAIVGISMEKNPKPIFNKHWRMNELYLIKTFMAAFAKAEPNTDKTLVFNAYNRVEKKKNLDYVLIFRKDERKVFHIIIKTNGQTYDFPIRGPQDISFGTGDIPEEEKSAIEWQFLTNFIANLMPMQMQLSSFPIEIPPGGPGAQGGYNRGGYGNGGYNRGGQNPNGGQGGNGGYAPRPNANGEFSSSSGLPNDSDLFE